MNTPKIVARHNRTDKPAGREFFYIDAHNDSKAHHIIINADGETFYNQAVLTGKTNPHVEAVWQDFYEWELVGCLEAHGYRKHIDQAIADNSAQIVDMVEKANAQSAQKAASEAPAKRLSDRIADAKKAAKREMGAPHMIATGLSYSCDSEKYEKDFVSRVTKKGLRFYIACCEGINPADVDTAEWKHTYYIEGQVDGADSLASYLSDGGFVSDQWIGAREYFDIQVTPDDLKRGG